MASKEQADSAYEAKVKAYEERLRKANEEDIRESEEIDRANHVRIKLAKAKRQLDEIEHAEKKLDQQRKAAHMERARLDFLLMSQKEREIHMLSLQIRAKNDGQSSISQEELNMLKALRF
jgi:hypothetical protein